MRAGQPSQTARGAAAYRAIHQTHEGGVIFRDSFAVKILDEETRAALDQIVADPAQRLMRLFITARSRFSEDALAASVARGVREVAVLGAGLDTFSLRNPFVDEGVRVFEVDHPGDTGLEAGAAGAGRHFAAGLAHFRARRFRAAKPCRWTGERRLRPQ